MKYDWDLTSVKLQMLGKNFLNCKMAEELLQGNEKVLSEEQKQEVLREYKVADQMMEEIIKELKDNGPDSLFSQHLCIK